MSSCRIRIADLWSGSRPSRPYLVAELSGNHNGSLDRALRLVDAAAACGVDAVKLQTYTADTITLNAPQEDFFVRSSGSAWDGRSLHELYAEASTPWEWHEALVARTKERGLEWFSSPFDPSAVEFLQGLDPVCYKIASPELVDLPLIRLCAATKKPLVMSTGMAALGEIEEAVRTARDAGCKQLVLLKCTTDYPASPKDAHLRTIAHMEGAFDCLGGLSDHTLGIGVAVAATALGAALIEKHLTLLRSDGGPDSHFSMEPAEMAALVTATHAAAESLGSVKYGTASSEKGYKRGRRSLYVCKPIQAGDTFTRDNIRSVRPGFGLHTRYYEQILGRKAALNLPLGAALRWEHLAPANQLASL